MKLEGITLEFSGGVTIKLWPQWSRVAILTPFDKSITLSFRDFQKALRLSRKPRRRNA